MSSLSTGRLFTAGALIALIAGAASRGSIDVFYHDRYFVLPIAQLCLAIAALCGVSAAAYLTFPLIFRTRLGEGLGKVHFSLTLACATLMFTLVGSDWTQPPSLAIMLPLFASAAILAASPLLLLVNMIRSLGRTPSDAARS